MFDRIRNLFSRQSKFVSDKRFYRQVKALRNFKQFLVDELCPYDESTLDSIDLEHLNELRYSFFGRPPTVEEWKFVDQKHSALTKLITPELRRRLQLFRVRWCFRSLPVTLLITAVVSLTAYVFIAIILAQPRIDAFFATTINLMSFTILPIIWTLSLGGLGATAFLGTTFIYQSRALESKQPSSSIISDEINMTDSDLITTRIIVGILFSFLISLPIAMNSIAVVGQNLLNGDDRAAVNVDDVLKMLLPFVLGFSTTLVLGIMDRFIGAVRILFGIGSDRGNRPREQEGSAA